ncbi:glycoside hydrolase family 11 protein [Fibrobacter sp. UWEL]|uniref:glycoside hydrolase family 11 protein n=1 Tax=Fibrobacter sp. UWEL TaxID=1896209 RepID=UPI0009238709|nr:glycoside hydrolase family 11 protein [Fibrobacter sp. UWEL]SHL04589.1 Carbohydrate binding module (family 6) [Fibrobacter sp. UWEL]
MNKKMIKASLFLAFGLAATSVYAADACKDEMAKPRGSAHTVNGNSTGSISGTPWGFEQWSGGGSNSMKYYDNGTFEATWSNNSDYLARVGYRYGDNGSGVDHKTKHYTVDYKYTKSGTAQYGYIGVYGWTVNPQVEYYIVDDWYSKPSEQYIGASRGTITVDGATYTIHAYLRQQEPSKTGTSTFLQIFSVRQSPRQCGHIDISAHFNKWDELFTGQTAQLSGSKGGGSTTLKFGRVTEVMLMNEAGGNATGSVNYTYFDMSDNGEASVIVPPKDIERSPFKSLSIPGTVEAEDFDNGNSGVVYEGATGQSGDDGDHEYRGEDYAQVDIVKNGTGRAIGYTAADEWLEYTVNVAEAGEYDVTASVANGSGAGSVTVKVGSASAKLSFTGTSNDWDAYENATGKITLAAGKQTMRITINNANTNIDFVKFAKAGSAEVTPTSSASQEPASSESKDALISSVQFVNSGKTFQVFDMQGKFMGRVDVVNGASLQDALMAKFQKAGVYMVRQGNRFQKVSVVK